MGRIPEHTPWRRRALAATMATIAAWIAALSVAGPAAAVSLDWQARWAEDLSFAQSEAVTRHPNLFHTLSREAWDGEFDSLIARLDSLEQHKVVVELARIVARIEDGHSRLTLPLGPGIDFEQGHSTTPDPKLESLRMHQYPVRFSIESGGVFVRRIAALDRQALGARVTKLGRLDVAAAIAAVAPTIEHDNPKQIEHHLPMHLVLAELLHARGVALRMDELPIEVELPSSQRLALKLKAVPHGESIAWSDARDEAAAPVPLYLQHPEKNFWLTLLEDGHTAYLQFNQVQNEEDESLLAFAARLERFLAEHEVKDLIIDLRANRGGDNTLSRPLLHAIIRSDANRTGHLFCLIGRTTFSAAMQFVLDLEDHTHVLFAGEPTGSKPNHYGDSRKILLPNSGLTLRISTLYWQHHPNDAREWVAPHLPVELTTADYRSNRDPVVENVLGIIAARRAGAGDLAGRWRGVASVDLHALEMSLDVTNGTTTAVSVKVPIIELDARARDVSVRGPSLDFVAEWNDEPILWSGTACGDWLIGEGELRTVRFPFVLKRGR